jgi:fatty-acid desaturase
MPCHTEQGKPSTVLQMVAALVAVAVVAVVVVVVVMSFLFSWPCVRLELVLFYLVQYAMNGARIGGG